MADHKDSFGKTNNTLSTKEKNGIYSALVRAAVVKVRCGGLLPSTTCPDNACGR